jgi:hypothetical protein
LNDIFKWVLGILGAIIMGISTWTLTTLMGVKEQGKVQSVEMSHMKEDLGDLKTELEKTKDTNELANKMFMKLLEIDDRLNKMRN